MPLTVTEVGKITEDIAIWRNAPTIERDFTLARDLNQTGWDAGKAIDCEGANFVQVMIWAQKAANRTEDVDLSIYGSRQTATALVAWSVFRVGISVERDSFFVASGSRPINDMAIDNSARWTAATRIERNRPAEADYPFAVDPFEYTVIQDRGLMPILQLKTKGIYRLMVEVRQGKLRPPTRLLVLSKLR